MKKTKIAVIALLVLCLLTGATAIVGNLEIVGASTSTTQLFMNEPLTAEQVYALLQSDPSVVIIDARDNAEYTGALSTAVAKAIFLGPTVFLMMAMRQHNYIDSRKRTDHTSATATTHFAAMRGPLRLFFRRRDILM